MRCKVADSRAAAFVSSAENATPLTAGVLVLIALGGVILLRKLKLSVSASV
jgi:hypothetical protein